jgi:hypothetical protein
MYATCQPADAAAESWDCCSDDDLSGADSEYSGSQALKTGSGEVSPVRERDATRLPRKHWTVKN